MMAEKSTNQAFLFQLGKFCCNLDKKVSHLKNLYDNKQGSHPQYYDRGLNIFKSELQQLKGMAEETKSKVVEMQKFSAFTESLQEIVSQQADEIMKMENYLKKFGYQVPKILEKNNEEVSSPLTKSDCSMQNKINGELDKPSSNLDDWSMLTPELSEAGKSILQGKRLPILDIIAAYDCDTTQDSTSSSAFVKSQSYEATPTSIRNIKNWIENVHAEASFSITPNVISQRPVISAKDRVRSHNERNRESQFRMANYNISNINENIKGNSNRSKFDSCFERDVSSISVKNESGRGRVDSFHNLASCTGEVHHNPKDPILSNVRSLLGNKDLERLTPEEPILSTSRYHLKKNYPTPEEPVLSSVTCNKPHLDGEEDLSPEEPVLNCLRGYASSVKNRQISPDGSPQSPQLSDITQKLLNVRSLRFSNCDAIPAVPSKIQSPARVKENNRQLEIRRDDDDDDDFLFQSPQMSDLTLRFLNRN